MKPERPARKDIMNFEAAVAANEEYFQYEGVELKREIRCAGCDEALDFSPTNDYTAHTATCTWITLNDIPEGERTYEVSDDALYEAHMTPDDDDDDYAYEAHKEWRRGL
jgi:hypothetical protein